MSKLRVVVPTPLSTELCELIEKLEPRVEVHIEPSLLPPTMYPGDHIGDPSFRRTAQQQASFERLVDSAQALYGVPAQSSAELNRTANANPRLQWVHSTPAGGGAQVKAARLNAEQLHRIAFSTSAGVHAEPLAEFVAFGVLAGAKTLPKLEHVRAERIWPGRWFMGRVRGGTAVVVGLGSIGRASAAKLNALGMHVVGVHRHQSPVVGVERIVPVEQLANVVADADVIVMTLPGTALTHHMLNAEILAKAKVGVTVVNVGRGDTIDENALIAALDDGRVGFAALDVFESEPLAPDAAIYDAPNVLISPHTAALDPGEERAIAELFAENATRLLDHRELINRVNTVEFY